MKSQEERRRFQRVEIELPVLTHLDEMSSLVVNLVDISTSGMQLKMRRSDLEALQQASSGETRDGRFEIWITARLVRVMPDKEGTYKTGWVFHPEEEEVLIG